MVPEGVEKIFDSAFINCERLGSVSLPASLGYFGQNVFSGCTALRTLTVAEDSPHYKASGGVLFTKDGSSLVCCLNAKTGSYKVPDGVTRIEPYAFSECSLTSVTLPDGLAEIGEYAFYFSRVAVVNFPESLTEIGEGAFYYCEYLGAAALPAGLSSLGEYAFYACYKLSKVTLPESVSVIGTGTFSYCSSLGTIVIPESVSVIESSAFRSCGLTSVTLPSDLVKIGSGAFEDCSRLTSVSFRGNQALWNQMVIESNNESLTGARISFNAS